MISLLGFDEESIEFLITGELALQVASMLGAPFGYKPQDRMHAECSVTLFRSPLTREFIIDKVHTDQGGDHDRTDAVCTDVECGPDGLSQTSFL